jgi:uncharacterized protein YodC (DUF2158 family)
MEKEFPKGARVRLVSGGPIMSVKGYDVPLSSFEEASIQCQWFSGKKLEHGNFVPETLVLVKGDEKESS